MFMEFDLLLDHVLLRNGLSVTVFAQVSFSVGQGRPLVRVVYSTSATLVIFRFSLFLFYCLDFR